jgi:glucosamine--fructose-6-phosphate aminotransferase (isomerizing)
MCGIIAAVAKFNVAPILLKGLKKLEYRGYDSCGLALHVDGKLQRLRSTSRLKDLEIQVAKANMSGFSGIAHTRWATHGAAVTHNAHPHFSRDRVALVHNGIIENHDELRVELQEAGYCFASQTDTEVIVHLIDSVYTNDLLVAVRIAIRRLTGTYAIAVSCADEPYRVVAARQGSPLVVGVGTNENFVASDTVALADTTDQIIYLEEGDLVDLQPQCVWIFDAMGKKVERDIKTVHMHSSGIGCGQYQHYMQKEIFEQPEAIYHTLEGITDITSELFGAEAFVSFKKTNSILILACGTSYYAGLVAKYWLESIAKIQVNVEIASEYRYRDSVTSPETLVITITQSGETADTLAALKHARSQGLENTLTICNVATSAMVRECTLAYITRAGIEVGVASTKAFTTQLIALFMLTLSLAKNRKLLSSQEESKYMEAVHKLPKALRGILALENHIMSWAEIFSRKENALFLGRGIHYPIALEGALKLKEVAYIHAEAYAAGELKHGPLALVTEEMPVVTVAPNDVLIEKLKSNMQEVRTRGGQLYVFADKDSRIEPSNGIHVIRLPENYGLLSPILHVVPLQLLAYYTALALGNDVDKPRNLAKSVTVE